MNLSNVKIKFDQQRIKTSYITACSHDVQCIKPGNVNHLSEEGNNIFFKNLTELLTQRVKE